MFASHQPQIAQFGMKNPDNLALTLTFVLLTIRWPLYRVPAAVASVKADGEASPALFGFKARAYREVWARRAWHHYQLSEVWDMRAGDAAGGRAAVTYLTHLHGFGLAKAGFAVQCLFGASACLDTHNLERFGYGPRAFQVFWRPNMRPATRREHVKRYSRAVDRLGGPQTLWDGWCSYVADREPDIYQSADHVSALHCEAIGC